MIAIHMPLGRMFGICRPIGASLVGLCLTSMVVGILANFFAVGIKYLIGALAAVLIALSLYEIFKSFKKIGNCSFSNFGKGFLLLAFGLGLFVLNSPQDTFYSSDQGVVQLSFNDHYAYYSGQSLEMLSAEYPSRLKAMNLFPKPWAKYHFFNSASQAVVQFFLPFRNLNTYFMAQVCIGVLVLLSFLEFLWSVPRKSFLMAVLGSLLWIYLGFSFFGSSLVWTLGTTGTFSVFAIFHLIHSLFERKAEKVFLFSVLLGVSAFRFVPVTAGLVGYWLYLEGALQFSKGVVPQREAFWNFFKSHRKFTALFLVFLIYVLFTLFLGGKNVEGRFFSEGPYNDGWMAILSVHNMIAYLLESLFRLHFFVPRDPPPVFLKFWPRSPLFGILMIAGLAPFFYFWIQKAGGVVRILNVWRSSCPKFSKTSFYRYRKILGFLLLAVLIYGAKLFFVSMIYLGLTTLIVLALKPYFPEENFESAKVSIFGMIGITVLMLLTGTNGVKAPMSYVTFDLALWVLIGLLVSKAFSMKSSFVWWISLASIFLFKVQLTELFKYPEMFSVNVSELEELRPSALDGQRFLTDAVKDLAKGDEKKLEAYSALFNGRLRFSPDYKTHRNFYHVNTED